MNGSLLWRYADTVFPPYFFNSNNNSLSVIEFDYAKTKKTYTSKLHVHIFFLFNRLFCAEFLS